MTSRLFKAAAAVSLLFLAATSCLWVRSVGHYGSVGYNGNVQVYAADRGGSFCFCFVDADPHATITGFFAERGTDFWGSSSLESGYAQAPTRRWMPKLWAGRTTPSAGAAGSNGGDFIVIVFSGYWLPCLVFAALPLAWFVRVRRMRHAERVGRCACGYDLRATPHRCPECGAIPMMQAAAALTAA